MDTLKSLAKGQGGTSYNDWLTILRAIEIELLLRYLGMQNEDENNENAGFKLLGLVKPDVIRIRKEGIIDLEIVQLLE